MTQFRLFFDEKVIELENNWQWDEAVEHLYQIWKRDPSDLNSLLCAGTEAWWVLVEFSYPFNRTEDETKKLSDPERIRKLSDPERIADHLTEITRWGFQHFSDNAVFNAYFGYMMGCIPLVFSDFFGDYPGRQEKGERMQKKGYQLEPANPFAKAMSWILIHDATRYRKACQELWGTVTPEEWGYSVVPRYFFCILQGYLIHKNAYGRTWD